MRSPKISTVVLTVLALALCVATLAQSPASPSDPQSPSAAPAQSTPTPSQSVPPRPQQQSNSPASGQSSAGAQSEAENPLHLTDEQKDKLRPILVEQNRQIEALRNDTTLTQEQKIAKANEIRQTNSPKIKAILTPEQLQKLAEMQQKARQNPPAQEPPH